MHWQSPCVALATDSAATHKRLPPHRHSTSTQLPPTTDLQPLSQSSITIASSLQREVRALSSQLRVASQRIAAEAAAGSGTKQQKR